MKDKTTVLFLNYEYPPLGGGAANATKYLLQEYAQRDDLEVHLVTSSVDDFRVEELSSNVTIHYLNIGKKGNFHYQSNKDLLTYSWKAYRYSKKLIQKYDFDLVHAFFGIPCGFIAQKLGLPYIASLRGSDVPFYNPRFEKLDKLLFQRMSRNIWKNSKATIANSQGLRDLALESSPTQDIGVIYNGVDISEFQTSNVSVAAMPSSPQSDSLSILAVGRLIPRKGFDILIQAAKDLPVTVTLVGDGPERESLEQLATETSVEVNFVGLIDHDEIVQYYQTHDLFALPSANEGMSNTVLEAMACGLPIITTNTGGTQELVTTNGWVIERTVKALRSALQESLDNREALAQMGRDSRARVEEMSWKKVADQYVEEYKR